MHMLLRTKQSLHKECIVLHKRLNTRATLSIAPREHTALAVVHLTLDEVQCATRTVQVLGRVQRLFVMELHIDVINISF